MKSLLLSGAMFALSCSAFAYTPQAIVQKVQNDGVVAGNTYRVYVQLENAESSLHAIWGDVDHPIMIESTAPFFQNALCGFSSRNMNDAITALDPTARFDSFITLGYESSENNTLWDIGVDFSSFDEGGEILSNNGAWFLLPSDEKCSPVSSQLVFIGQFTTTGILTGKVNLQGKDANGEVWRALDVSFTSENAEEVAEVAPVEVVASVASLEQEVSNEWMIFPNPVRDQLIHIQFNTDSAKDQRYALDIYDMSGRKIASHVLNSGHWVAGNRVTIEQNLAAGTYQISLIADGKVSSQTLVVAK